MLKKTILKYIQCYLRLEFNCVLYFYFLIFVLYFYLLNLATLCMVIKYFSENLVWGKDI